VPITVPITAIYTRNDGVVAWQACIDRTSPQVEHVEVRSTHLGLGVDPEVFRIVALHLAPAAG
jgi:poly(3-hydroxyalkanoate) synthetase